MTIMTYIHENYGLELENSEGRVWVDGKLMFKGFSGIAIQEYLRYAPEEKKKFRTQLVGKFRADHLNNLRPMPQES